MSGLVKSRVLLHYMPDELGEIAGWASYYSTDEDDVYEMLELPVDKWEDFGKPDKLTITVEVGDLLNDPVDALTDTPDE